MVSSPKKKGLWWTPPGAEWKNAAHPVDKADWCIGGAGSLWPMQRTSLQRAGSTLSATTDDGRVVLRRWLGAAAAIYICAESPASCRRGSILERDASVNTCCSFCARCCSCLGSQFSRQAQTLRSPFPSTFLPSHGLVRAAAGTDVHLCGRSRVGKLLAQDFEVSRGDTRRYWRDEY